MNPTTHSKSKTLINPILVRTAGILTFTLLTALASQIRIPVPGTVIPMTMQTAVVLLAGLCLGSKDGALSQALYLGGRLAGLPLFVGSTGLAALFGPTGGYLIGFIVATYALGMLKPYAKSFLSTWILTFATSFLIFIPGVIGLKLFSGNTLSWSAAVFGGFVPFIIGDLVKVTLTATSYSLYRKTSN